MVSDIFASLGDCLESLGYVVKYSIGEKGNSTRLPLAEIDIKDTQVAVYQTISNINQVNFDLMIYHAQVKTDTDALSDLHLLEEFETVKKSLNQSLRDWDIATSFSLAGHYGLSWNFQGQGINKEFAQNKPVKMIVLSCELQYSDI